MATPISRSTSHADLYQPPAYATALNLPGWLLVYAQGETADAVHVIRHAGKRWKSPRWIFPGRSAICAVASTGWRSGSAACTTPV